MTNWLEVLGSAVWRASWQGSAIACVVAVFAWLCGTRLTPRSRHWPWSVVLIRFLLIWIPTSPWSAFHLMTQWDRAVTHESESQSIFVDSHYESAPISEAPSTVDAELLPLRELITEPPTTVTSSADAWPDGAVPPFVVAADAPLSVRVQGWWPVLWLIGCGCFGLRLLISGAAVRRRLRACRVATDPELLGTMKEIQQAMGIRRSPRLCVSPDSISPYLLTPTLLLA